MLLFGINLTLSAYSNYDKSWTTVADFEKRSLPQSALAEVNKIYVTAVKEKNSPQVIKALIHKMKFETATTDNWENIFPQVEQLAVDSTNKVEQAILNSMLAEMYLQYYNRNQWNIGQRTAIMGYVPEKMDEWSENIFLDKFLEHLRLSLLPAGTLQKIPATDYKDILILGSDSRNLRPTLFDFLAYRGLDFLSSNQALINKYYISKNLGEEYFGKVKDFIALKIDSVSNSYTDFSAGIYQQLLSSHLNNSTPDALLYTDLERINFVFNNSGSSKDSLYLDYLVNLEKKFEKNPLLVEVKYSLANYYLSQARDFSNIAPSQQTKEDSLEFVKTINDFYTKANEICKNGIKDFPQYSRINILKNLQQTINQPTLEINTNQVSYPNTEISFNINYRNLQKAALKIYKVNMSLEEFSEKNRYYSDAQKIQGNLIYSKNIDLPQKEIFVKQSTSINIPGLDYGIYQFEITSDGVSGNSQKGFFYISKFALISRDRDNSLEYFVVDRITGEPQKDVAITVFKQEYINRKTEYNKIAGFPTNENGFASYKYKGNQSLFVALSAGNDAFHPLTNNYVSPKNNVNNEDITRENISLFSDRAIYRPGQKVYFKGIAYNQTNSAVNIIEDKNYKIELFDANWQKIDSLQLTTNEFGSFTGEFTLPQNVLSGNFTIRANSQNMSFRVEEYKRPTIEINIDNIKTAYTFGDSIAFSGEVMNYAGYSAQFVEVRYRIVKEPNFIFFGSRNTSEELKNGNTLTGENGKFSIDFKLPQAEKSRFSFWGFNYILYVEATDNKGETQKNEFRFNILPKSISLKSNISTTNFIRKNSDKDITISAKNANGQTLLPTVDFEIFALKTSNETVEAVLKGKINLAENNSTINFPSRGTMFISDENNIWENKIHIPNFVLSMLESGKYKIKFSAEDEKGRESTIEQEFFIYDINDTKLPGTINLFADNINTEFSADENAEILFGTSFENAKVLFQIMKDNQVLKSEWLDFSNNMQLFEIPYKEEFGKGIDAEFLFVKNAHIFRYTATLNKKEESKQLDIKFTSFRDKLLPGQNEEWIIKIAGKDGKPVNAEFLASLYDASLDIFAKNNWSFTPAPFVPYFYQTPWNTNIISSTNASVSFNTKYNDVKNLNFDILNWFGLNFYQNMLRLRGASSIIVKNDVEEEMSLSDGFATSSEQILKGKVAGLNAVAASGSLEADMAYNMATSQAENTSPTNIQARTNFNETAFFFPQLRTNEQGEVLLSFTMPESVTRWNFMGLAHTKTLEYGQISANTVTQKPFMIRPNMPRFVRVNDKMTLTAEIVNLTDKNISGETNLEVINPIDNKLIVRKTLKFKVDAGRTTTVSWNYDVTKDFDLLIFKVTANDNEFSDGEQNLLPVLSNKMFVTETLPLTVRGKETKDFTFDNFANNNSSSLENKSYTIEFSSNPSWYAVQALPSLSVNSSNNSVAFFSAYYANALASYMLNSNPKIAEVFAQWKNEENPTSLLSKLEQNEELKNVLLQETPWVAEAKSETEQMQRIALLFDLNNITVSTKYMFDQLQEMQLPNGAFTWFNGMSENRFVTQFIMDGMAKLRNIGVVNFTSEEENLQQKAIGFIDFCIKDDFARLKKYSKDYRNEQNLSSMQIYYHYIRTSFANIPVPKDTQEAFDFYLSQIEKYWTSRNLYEQAMIAIVLQKQGKKDTALDIIKSLREHATMSEEFGMYWAKNTNSYFWNQSAIQTQCALIEAFAAVVGDKEEIDNMKIWLLKQKQTQMWDSNISTVDAIYALLLQGSDRLGNNEKVSISVGGKKLEEEQTAGVGYLKKTFASNEITPKLGNISITKKDDGIAWGAAYWQYLEDVDKIKNIQGDFSLEKKLFVERLNDKGRFLEPLTDKTQLKIGEKVVVHLTVRTDRDLEYVHLRDLRASCLEPTEQLSRYQWRNGVGFYQTTGDVSIQYFFDFMPKGSYVFEYDLWVARSGEYSNGIGTIQCLYAPEFSNNTNSIHLKISK
jgi:uncharacterized protein YfaS (alpha-2-macroglobulin family)